VSSSSSETAETDELRIIDNSQLNRYEVFVGPVLAGFADYHAQPGLVTLKHTEIKPAFRERGIGSRLIAGALADIREREAGVLPICPFVRAYLQRHPEYADMVALALGQANPRR
jgi:uncharacterized protein